MKRRTQKAKSKRNVKLSYLKRWICMNSPKEAEGKSRKEEKEIRGRFIESHRRLCNQIAFTVSPF